MKIIVFELLSSEIIKKYMYFKRNNIDCSNLESDIRLEMARYMEDLCDTEMYDIEMCSECFCRVNTMKNWFTEVCSPPHLVVWAR